ncbi:lytic transglycosylase domain-containing protein [Noviherbaspirillum saxi]|uniref:Lytic transglycosylase domain-containing protein n=1 Tax=Noviherbaspirillum saxi TaxID=2320863 RepID=A0A3A3FJ93_9BURK|nr:lytic transglycosylase domain-containing protein [Noviherbaspirillum saxi]RJF95357.1 lytic transglycosylase domain-containing protein [Noviherbaspirillum saxi]
MSAEQLRYQGGTGAKSIFAPARAFHSNLHPLLAAVAFSGLLTGCAGMLPFDGSAPAAPEASAYPTPHSIGARHILAEWGTFGIDQRRYGPGQKRSARHAPMLDAIPDYSATIQEIMANAVCRSCDEKPYHRLVLSASDRHGVPASLIHAVIQKESNYNPSAMSHKQARGLMQVTPGTARFVGVGKHDNLYDPQININAGTAYLKYLMQNHATFDQVLAAYNSGPGNVRKYKGVPPFLETQRYVKDVKRFYFVTAKE